MNAAADVQGLARRVVELGLQHGLTFATAESLTGGRLADAIVSVPGASRVFLGGVVAYDTDLKRRLLAVDAELLARVGPVDGEVARQMARGVREHCAASPGSGPPVPAAIGISTTGVAGPDPDPRTGQPPGTVWVSVSANDGDRLEGLELAGSRDVIRDATVHCALELVLQYLSQLDSSSGKFQE